MAHFPIVHFDPEVVKHTVAHVAHFVQRHASEAALISTNGLGVVGNALWTQNEARKTRKIQEAAIAQERKDKLDERFEESYKSLHRGETGWYSFVKLGLQAEQPPAKVSDLLSTWAHERAHQAKTEEEVEEYSFLKRFDERYIIDFSPDSQDQAQKIKFVTKPGLPPLEVPASMRKKPPFASMSMRHLPERVVQRGIDYARLEFELEDEGREGSLPVFEFEFEPVEVMYVQVRKLHCITPENEHLYPEYRRKYARVKEEYPRAKGNRLSMRVANPKSLHFPVQESHQLVKAEPMFRPKPTLLQGRSMAWMSVLALIAFVLLLIFERIQKWVRSAHLFG